MDITVLIICLLLMLVAAAAAAMFRSGLKAAISLAVVSIFLSIILFLMGCTVAALFELSVCAGLITVIFISTISMTTKDRESEANMADHHRRFAALPFVLIFAGVALISVVMLTGFDVESTIGNVPAAEESFKNIFWNTRQTDILGQIIVMLAGAFAVVILFKESDKA